MKITIEGSEKKIKQLIKELTPRVRLDKLKLIEGKDIKKKETKKANKVVEHKK